MSDKEDTRRSRALPVTAPGIPSANGIMLSLYKLAEEAADLGLMSSHAAIRHAIEICDAERSSGAAVLLNTRLN